MTKNDRAVLDRLLQDLSDRYSNAGCNDFELEDTPDNRELVKTAESLCDAFDGFRLSRGKLCTVDWMVVAELRKRLEGEG